MDKTDCPEQTFNAAQIWQQVCAVYSEPWAQTLCLNWQNQYSANVNLVLIFTLVQKQGYQFSETQLAELVRDLNEFSEQTTALVRQARINWRSQSDKSEYHNIKKSLLACELEFEQQEQALIVESLNRALNQKPQTALLQKPANWYIQQLGISNDLERLLNAFSK